MRELAHRWIAHQRKLDAGGLHGFVNKARSPSCGIGDVKRYPELPQGASREDDDDFLRDGTGLFAAALLETLPGLPVINEEELKSVDALIRFLAQVRTYARVGSP